LAVSLALLLVAEGLARLIFGAPPTPTVVRPMMGEYGSYFTVEDGWVSTTYQDGDFDGACQAFPRETEEPRIAVLGGSSVRTTSFVAPEERFSDLIGERTGIETLNLGCSGADSFDLVRVLEELLDWPLTMVVLYSGHCDVGNAFLLRRYSTVGGRLTARLQPLLENSQLFVRYRRLLTPYSRAAPPGDEAQGLQPAEVARIERGFERNLGRIVELCRSHGVALVMSVPTSDLTFPPPDVPYGPGQRAYQAWEKGVGLLSSDPDRAIELLDEAVSHSARPVRASTAIEEIVRRVALENDVALVDARRDMPRDGSGSIPDPDLYEDELHMSRVGHASLADLLVPVILEQLPEEGEAGR
jgi:lysophospholipase L1-like esterase